jgi:aspartyl-tRNA(Asn)/glutamyl-tRNA(Gln) amidotransferase subunit C
MTAARLSREDVAHIARLARLDLTDAELDRFTHDLGAILDYASEIQAVDTSRVAPMSHAAAVGDEASESRPAARADTPEPSLSRDVALSNAPDAAAGMFRVPKVRDGK